MRPANALLRLTLRLRRVFVKSASWLLAFFQRRGSGRTPDSQVPVCIGWPLPVSSLLKGVSVYTYLCTEHWLVTFTKTQAIFYPDGWLQLVRPCLQVFSCEPMSRCGEIPVQSTLPVTTPSNITCFFRGNMLWTWFYDEKDLRFFGFQPKVVTQSSCAL